MKKLDLNQNILTLTEQYPELIELLKELGFTEITNPVMRKTAGRIMTIPKGCQMKGVNLDTVKGKLEEHGFIIAGE